MLTPNLPQESDYWQVRWKFPKTLDVRTWLMPFAQSSDLDPSWRTEGHRPLGSLEQAACLGDHSRVVGCMEVRTHPWMETRSDPIGRRPDAFIAEIDFGLPPIMRHMKVQG